MLSEIIREVGRHRASERAAEAPNLSNQSEIFDHKLKDRFTIMKAKEWIWASLWPTVIPIIPSHHIDIILHEELEPEAIWRVDLLLIALSIRTEENYRWVFRILQGCLILDIFVLIDTLQLVNCENFLIIEREEHTVQLCSILSFDPKSPSVKDLFKHIFCLIVRVKNIFVFEPEQIGPEAAKIDRAVSLLYKPSKLLRKLF